MKQKELFSYPPLPPKKENQLNCSIFPPSTVFGINCDFGYFWSQHASVSHKHTKLKSEVIWPRLLPIRFDGDSPRHRLGRNEKENAGKNSHIQQLLFSLFVTVRQDTCIYSTRESCDQADLHYTLIMTDTFHDQALLQATVQFLLQSQS